MLRFWILQAIVIATALLLWATGPSSEASVLGMAPICSGTTTETCWLAFGGSGVITFGAGVGFVFYGAWGAGLLFGVGQATAGLIAFGQVAVGFTFCCAQLGAGLSALGQLVFGGRVLGQLGVGWSGAGFLGSLHKELEIVLDPRFKRRVSLAKTSA